MEEVNKTRYSDEELEEFRGIINEMLEKPVQSITPFAKP